MIRHRGLSLIELVISLAILATLATVALRASGGLQSQTRYQVTTQTLNEIRSAVLGVPNQHGPDGSVQVTGFVADTGRLPNYLTSASDTATSPDPLNELLQPNGIPAFGFVQANTDTSVLVGVGWNGPYMRLGAGAGFIRDGWGNSFHTYDGGGTLLTTAGNSIFQISSWGGDNAADTNHGGTGDLAVYNADISIPNASNLTSGGFNVSGLFYGLVRMNIAADTVGPNSGPPIGQSGPYPNSTYTDSASNPHTISIWVCYYGPDLASTPRPVFDLPVKVVGPNWQYTLSDPKITIGPRELKAYVVDSTVITNLSTFRANVNSAPNPLTGPVFFVSALNVTATGGSQAGPTLMLPHYAP